MYNLKTLPETASELGTEARNSMEELGRSAAKKLEEARVETAGALHSAASSVRATGRKGSEAIDKLVTKTAERLDASGAYIENHGLKDAYSGMQSFGSRHLAGSLVAAAAIGFLAGSAFGRMANPPAKTRTV